jgi:preprotein translocase subunit SecE
MTWPVWAEVQRLTIVAIFSIIIRSSLWELDEFFASALAGFF